MDAELDRLQQAVEAIGKQMEIVNERLLELDTAGAEARLKEREPSHAPCALAAADEEPGMFGVAADEGHLYVSDARRHRVHSFVLRWAPPARPTCR